MPGMVHKGRYYRRAFFPPEFSHFGNSLAGKIPEKLNSQHCDRTPPKLWETNISDDNGPKQSYVASLDAWTHQLRCSVCRSRAAGV